MITKDSSYEITIDNNTNEVVKSKKNIFMGSQRVCEIEKTDDEIHAYFIHADHIGSSNIITDESGSRVLLFEYKPFGSVAYAAEDNTYDTDKKFTGKTYDSSSGLYYYGARYYDSELGRFITADPTIQHPYDPQDYNRYTYARNNPVKYIDPTGYGWFSKFFKSIGNWFKEVFSNPAAIIGMVAGAIIGGFIGYYAAAGIASSFMLTGGTITALEGGILTGVEFGIAWFFASAGGAIGAGKDVGDIFTAGGLGFAAGFISGFTVGYTYAAGIQSSFHGFDSKAANELYSTAQEALGKGQFELYNKASRELMKMGVTPPAAVLQGKSPIAGGANHTFLSTAKFGEVKSMGADAVAKFKSQAILARTAVPGYVRNESIETLSQATFRVLTTDLSKVETVWKNMDIVKHPIYELFSQERNCYGWVNKVLVKSGLPKIDPTNVW